MGKSFRRCGAEGFKDADHLDSTEVKRSDLQPTVAMRKQVARAATILFGARRRRYKHTEHKGNCRYSLRGHPPAHPTNITFCSAWSTRSRASPASSSVRYTKVTTGAPCRFLMLKLLPKTFPCCVSSTGPTVHSMVMPLLHVSTEN